MLLPTLATLTALLALLTLLPLSRYQAWWVRDLDFPRLQLAIALGVLLAAELITLELTRPVTWLLVGITLACLVYQAWWILPYTPIYPVEVRYCEKPDPESMIRVMAANVLTPNRNSDGLLGLIRTHQPDVLVTLESDAWWQSRLDVLRGDYPYTISCPLDNLYGMHVYSRLVLEDSRTQFLVEPDIPSMSAAVLLRSGQRVHMHFVHPAPPSPTENDTSEERDAELLVVGKSVAESDSAVIVMGDLNDVAWSESTRLFRKVSGLLDPRVGRGMYNTFNAKHWFARWPLDHVFHSQNFTVSRIERLPHFGSDHFPVLMELAYEGDQCTGQEGLEADSSDEAEAARKTAAQGVSESEVHEPKS